ncbi:hypothetical protein AVEN_203229-1 [Araneus ventricosus]|uniref:Uncharacterized protein n=1 Tax=Araneus ventricosus TaxID=182803 RepID=A0A4Y2F405_ARAVE|nr:hypothetical protein AVEN_203229-1 [Araneus ventricosus]
MKRGGRCACEREEQLGLLDARSIVAGNEMGAAITASIGTPDWRFQESVAEIRSNLLESPISMSQGHITSGCYDIFCLVKAYLATSERNHLGGSDGKGEGVNALPEKNRKADPQIFAWSKSEKTSSAIPTTARIRC